MLYFLAGRIGDCQTLHALVTLQLFEVDLGPMWRLAVARTLQMDFQVTTFSAPEQPRMIKSHISNDVERSYI
jgi:hypothetical protein